MSESARIGLDNPVFRGRLRVSFERSTPGPTITRSNYLAPSYPNGRTVTSPTVYRSAAPVSTPASSMPPTPAPRPLAEPVRPKLQPSRVLRRQLVKAPLGRKNSTQQARSHYSRSQLALVGLACLIAICGLSVAWQGLRTNHAAAAQIAILTKQVDKQSNNTGGQNAAVPSTTKPSGQAISQYVVAPDLPRYLKIPKLGVYARVMQTGVTSSGALGTPNNVYDTAWYTGSAKPGQPGATLIDGHVSSWTSHGVFYGIKTLVAGDMIQVVRGDGAVLNYQVVKTEVYNAGNVDMQAAITPITAGKSGLNLITCTGQVEKGTSEFNQRVIVFAQQV